LDTGISANKTKLLGLKLNTGFPQAPVQGLEVKPQTCFGYKNGFGEIAVKNDKNIFIARSHIENSYIFKGTYPEM
jgi:hypothetical protein